MKKNLLITILILAVIGLVVYIATSSNEVTTQLEVDQGQSFPILGQDGSDPFGQTMLAGEMPDYPFVDFHTDPLDTPQVLRWHNIAYTLPPFWVAKSADGGTVSNLLVAAPGSKEAITIATFTLNCSDDDLENPEQLDCDKEKDSELVIAEVAESEFSTEVQTIVDSVVVITEENSGEFADLKVTP